jgi:hypothetical protein
MGPSQRTHVITNKLNMREGGGKENRYDLTARPLIKTRTKLKKFQVKVRLSHHCKTLEDCQG